MSDTTVREFDVYQSDLAPRQLNYDAEDYRRSLYTNTKDDHPADPLTGGPCDCEAGGCGWEQAGAMRVAWPENFGDRRMDLEAGR